MAGNGSAYIASAAFSLSDFYDRYSPHAYIDYSRVYVRHPKPKREYIRVEDTIVGFCVDCTFFPSIIQLSTEVDRVEI